jgi:hypothetical protein
VKRVNRIVRLGWLALLILWGVVALILLITRDASLTNIVAFWGAMMCSTLDRIADRLGGDE